MIEVIDISKSFRRKNVLDGISFKLNKGEITALLGINGVGKSTTLKIIMGLIKQDKGIRKKLMKCLKDLNLIKKIN